MTDLLKHGVIIARYFSLYGLELDLWSSVLALPVTRQMHAQTGQLCTALKARLFGFLLS